MPAHADVGLNLDSKD